MPDKEPQFTVTDRRKFTLEGDLRGGEDTNATSAGATAAEQSAAAAAPSTSTVSQAPAPPADTSTEESAQQDEDYEASTREVGDLFRQASAGGGADIPMNFDRLVQTIYMTAAVQLGAGTAPNEQPRIDILGARQSIDMLGVLEEKTRGNLTEEEKRLLQGALFDLRMSFLEITNAIASSGQKPSDGGAAR